MLEQLREAIAFLDQTFWDVFLKCDEIDFFGVIPLFLLLSFLEIVELMSNLISSLKSLLSSCEIRKLLP